MKVVFLVFFMCIALNTSYTETLDVYAPDQSLEPCISNQIDCSTDDVRYAHAIGVEYNPFYYSLEMLTQQERENAKIEIEFMQSVSNEVNDFSNQIVQIWNSGRFDEALVLFTELDLMTGVEGNALINISWRNPIPAPVTEWGDDVQISARDSVFVLAMDRDNSNGNLLAVLGFTGDGQASRYSVNISTNGGVSWSETHTLGGYPFEMNDVDGCVVSDHFYVIYTGGGSTTPNTMAWIKRFRTSDGAPVDMPNGSSTYNILNTTEFVDVELASNQDAINNILYFCFIEDDGDLRYFYNYIANVTWTEIATGISDAQQGLDLNYNHLGSALFYLSYINNSDELKIYSRTGWVNEYTYNINNTYPYYTTSIDAYADTILCAYTYRNTTASETRIRYNIQYDGGTWFYSHICSSVSYAPDVTLKHDGGIHVVYREGTIAGTYMNREYYGGWSTPEVFSDHYMTGNFRPEIVYIASGVYGTLYCTYNSSPTYGTCFFDRSDWTTGIEENISTDINSPINVRLSPNPSISDVQISYTVKSTGNVSISLFDATGRLVNNILNETKTTGHHTLTIREQDILPGIYFIRVETPDNVETKPLTIIK